MTPSHAQLVKEAANWLRNTRRCRVVATELVTTFSPETPDAIGWGTQFSILVECKTSRADFLADAKKPHRRWAGLGQERWFYAPKGIIFKEDLPPGWGLLERREYGDRHQCLQVVPATVREASGDLLKNERGILVSIAWRSLEALSLVKPLTISEKIITIPTSPTGAT